MKRRAGIVVCALLAACSVASAYEYTPCGSGECYWEQFPIGYVVAWNVDELFGGAAQVVQDSLSRWNQDRQTFCDIQMNYGGRTNTAAANDDGDNVIFAKTSGWTLGTETLAVTQCFFEASGRMVDCDTAVNAQDWKWADGSGAEPGTLNFRDTVTHEAGHFWGLGHSADHYATMYTYYTEMTVAADLDEDDIRGAADRYCDGEMPPDDGHEQDDSLYTPTDVVEPGAFTDRRLYDTDVYRLKTEGGLFPLITGTDREPSRHKLISVFGPDQTLLGTSPCDGDCVVAPILYSVDAGFVYVKIETDFSRSRVSDKSYDVTIEMVNEVDEAILTDDEEDDDAGDDDDDDDDQSCGCAIAGGADGAKGDGGVAFLFACTLILAHRIRSRAAGRETPGPPAAARSEVRAEP